MGQEACGEKGSKDFKGQNFTEKFTVVFRWKILIVVEANHEDFFATSLRIFRLIGNFFREKEPDTEWLFQFKSEWLCHEFWYGTKCVMVDRC